jgi:hypothetical protein
MKWGTAITATATALLALSSGLSWPQTAATTQHPAATSDSAPADAGLGDLDSMTFSCPKAALNAAAREAAKFPAKGTYQFAYFNIITGSHHARYEVHFKSNYQGEQDLKYCVVLYCQQGWDPASAKPTVTLLNGSPATSDSHMESCAETPPARPVHPKATTP